MKQPILPVTTIEHTPVEFEKEFKFGGYTIIPFEYSRGNRGYLARKYGREINLTVNIMDSSNHVNHVLLKMWGDAEQINHQFIKRFHKLKSVTVGVNRAWECVPK